MLEIVAPFEDYPLVHKSGMFVQVGAQIGCIASVDQIDGAPKFGVFDAFVVRRRNSHFGPPFQMNVLCSSISHMRLAMRRAVIALLFSACARILLAQGAPTQTAAGRPYTVEYYYKVQWGHQQEFLQLFLKNHYPLLQKIVESGRMVSVKIETPANHMPEEARWDYRVTIRFKDSTVATTPNPDEGRLIKQLWPDQDTYQREEQRRFEILLAHWDLPVTEISPAQQ
jgi:hypothetical protein